MKATLDYADNPDKTTDRRYLDDDLYAALSYAENDNKTDRKMYVGGINCSKQNAYAEMIAVQRRFGLRGKVVGYHGIQSFREGEVTPEQAFEIGKATARKMWGDRYQVLVTVHLNTENVHCHLSDLEHERNTLSNRIRRPKSPEDENQNKETRKAISKQMKPIRERLRHAEKILEKSPHLYELLKQEHELERKARARYLDRSR